MIELVEFEADTGVRHVEMPGASSHFVKAARRRSRQRLIAILLAMALAMGFGAAILLQSGAVSPAWFNASRPAAGPSASMALPNLPPPDLVRPLTPQEARTRNAERPIVTRPQEPAARFRLTGNEISRLRATDCLTQAIYYEAASEGMDGGRAVAQVVLNRTRHPGYPSSICGVVYEGSSGPSGCQFTFTCDGSLARVPVGYLWARSRQIATEALAGRVFAPVGYATHYHADYVLPYWADSLEKIAVVGRHIFYRLPGSVGSKAAFSQRYASKEPLPPPPPAPSDELIDSALTAVVGAPAATAVPEPPRLEADKVGALALAPTAETQTNSPLQADLARGQLIIGEPTPSAQPKAKAPAKSGCDRPPQGPVQRVRPENLKVGGTAQTC